MAIFSLHLFCRGMNNLNVQNAAMVGKAPKIGVLNPPSAAQMLPPQQSRAEMPQKMQAGHIVQNTQNAQNVENVERAGKKFALPKIKKELPLTTKIAFACQAAVAAIATVFTVKGIINLVKKFKK